MHASNLVMEATIKICTEIRLPLRILIKIAQDTINVSSVKKRKTTQNFSINRLYCDSRYSATKGGSARISVKTEKDIKNRNMLIFK
ncbi:MAG: hypothetical protein ACOH2A_13945 [Sphingobacteriaceae bacterium]